MAKTNLAGAGSGALGGAGTGFAIGGPIGAGIGGLVGGLAGLFGGGRKKKKKISTLDKRQQQINESQYQALLGEGPLADLYNYDPKGANEVFNQITARPAQRNFRESTVPGITGAFRKQGLMESSYVGDALSKAGRDVQENLDALRAQALYGEKQGAQNARRNAVENFQNRQTFAYEKPAPGSNFDIGQVLSGITPDMISGLQGLFSGSGVNGKAGSSLGRAR